MATQALLEREAEALTRKGGELAKSDNPMALRLCLERLLSPRKDRPIIFALAQLAGYFSLLLRLVVINGPER